MTRFHRVLYYLMAVWLILASAGRVALMTNGNQELDALPFIGFGLGLTALITVLLTPERRP